MTLDKNELIEKLNASDDFALLPVYVSVRLMDVDDEECRGHRFSISEINWSINTDTLDPHRGEALEIEIHQNEGLTVWEKVDFWEEVAKDLAGKLSGYVAADKDRLLKDAKGRVHRRIESGEDEANT